MKKIIAFLAFFILSACTHKHESQITLPNTEINGIRLRCKVCYNKFHSNNQERNIEMEVEKSLDFWSEVKNIFKKISDKFDTQWQKRKRILSTQLLVAFIIKLVQSKNKQGYGSILNQFWEVCLEKGILLPQPNSIAASSFCEARQKLPEDIFKELNQELLGHWNKVQNLPTWKGL